MCQHMLMNFCIRARHGMPRSGNCIKHNTLYSSLSQFDIRRCWDIKSSATPTTKYANILVNHRTFHLSPTNYAKLSDSYSRIPWKEGFSALKEIQFEDIKSSPPSALRLGLGGLIPFVAPPLYFVVFGFSNFLVISQLAYGATILAFVGGVKWGYSLPPHGNATWDELGWSVVPSLVAWTGLMLPYHFGCLVIITGLGSAVFVDLISSCYPPWFKALRVVLTSGAIASLLVSFIATLFAK